MSTKPEEIQITGEPTADPSVCKFTINQPVYEKGSITCSSVDEAKGSPLLEKLFAISGIRQVLVFGHTITIAKVSTEAWPLLGKQIGLAIRESFGSGDPLIDPAHAERKPSELELKERVEALLEEQINPYVASHGGRISVVDVKGSSVYVELSGGCQGCASATATLKQGVERIILQNLPQITEVLDITDHAQGASPYYS